MDHDINNNCCDNRMFINDSAMRVDVRRGDGNGDRGTVPRESKATAREGQLLIVGVEMEGCVTILGHHAVQPCLRHETVARVEARIDSDRAGDGSVGCCGGKGVTMMMEGGTNSRRG